MQITDDDYNYKLGYVSKLHSMFHIFQFGYITWFERRECSIAPPNSKIPNTMVKSEKIGPQKARQARTYYSLVVPQRVWMLALCSRGVKADTLYLIGISWQPPSSNSPLSLPRVWNCPRGQWRGYIRAESALLDDIGENQGEKLRHRQPGDGTGRMSRTSVVRTHW